MALIGLEETDLVWLQRFGQAGRLSIGQKRLRAVTWMAEPAGKLIEVHLLCSHQRILTFWRGDAAILDTLRQHFVERVGEVGKSPFQATGILLQLLLSTLDHAIRSLDMQLDHLRAQLDDRATNATMPDLPVNIRSCRLPGSVSTDTPAQYAQRWSGSKPCPGWTRAAQKN